MTRLAPRPAETLAWADVPALNSWGGDVYRAPDGRLVQVGKTARTRAANPRWGWRDIVSIAYYSADGKSLLTSETTTPAQFRARRWPQVRMVARHATPRPLRCRGYDDGCTCDRCRAARPRPAGTVFARRVLGIEVWEDGEGNLLGAGPGPETVR